MLIKSVTIENHYVNGFDDNLNIFTKVLDADRDLELFSGKYISEYMEAKINGFILGMNLAGYEVAVIKKIDIDDKTGSKREDISNI